uniref:Uncharacterized protein n=2 Tax=Emiliania huxleyi TaxID=2903 RepID=A0A7S3S6K1_EMIHU
MDRFTEQRAERAVDGIYSVAINLHNFHEGASYFGIRCGAAARRFRVVVHRMDAIVPPDGGKHHGEVCPGVWVYHFYDVPATASGGGGVTFHVEKHEGDVDLVTRHGQAPVKLVPPFKYMGADEYEGSISLCNIKPGERLYLGMLGGDHCASYEVFATPLNASTPCEEPLHAPLHAGAQAQALIVDKIAFGSCNAYAWQDWSIALDAHEMQDNFIFELQTRSSALRLNGLSVSLFIDEIPLSRVSEIVAHTAHDGIYAISLSSHDFEPIAGQNRRLFFGVKCGSLPVRYQVVTHLMHSEIHAEEIAHGEACPGDWIYHSIALDEHLAHMTPYSSLVAARSAANARLGVGTSSSHRRRMVSTGDTSSSTHLLVVVEKVVGSMAIRPEFNQAPLVLVPPYKYMHEEEGHSELTICNVSRFFNHDPVFKYHLGIVGSKHCAHYGLTVEPFTGDCHHGMPAAHRRTRSRSLASSSSESAEDTSHIGPDKHGALYCSGAENACALSIRHYTYGSCTELARHVPFTFELTREQLNSNLVVVVADLNDADYSSSLSLTLYHGSGTHEALVDSAMPLASTQAGRARLFSVGLDAFTLQSKVCNRANCSQAGVETFSLVVGCAATPVRFSVLVEVVDLPLEPEVPVHGEVCPGSWMYHKLPGVARGEAVRFTLHVHEGNAYYAMVRWDAPPSFASCNKNEVELSEVDSSAPASIELCPAGDSADDAADAYIGIFGGLSCAIYTLEATAFELDSGATCASSHTVIGGPCLGETSLKSEGIPAGSIVPIFLGAFFGGSVLVFAVWAMIVSRRAEEGRPARTIKNLLHFVRPQLTMPIDAPVGQSAPPSVPPSPPPSAEGEEAKLSSAGGLHI